MGIVQWRKGSESRSADMPTKFGIRRASAHAAVKYGEHRATTQRDSCSEGTVEDVRKKEGILIAKRVEKRTNCAQNSARPARVGRDADRRMRRNDKSKGKAVVVGTSEGKTRSGKVVGYLSRLTCESGIGHCCRGRSWHCRDPMRGRQRAPAKTQ